MHDILAKSRKEANEKRRKKQFDDKIKKWGFKKNASKADRALLLKDNARGLKAETFQKTTLKLNPKKLQRWEREEKFSNPPESVFLGPNKGRLCKLCFPIYR